MTAARLCAGLGFALLGCAPVVELQTDPIAQQSIPVTSIGVQAFAELAIDLPPESQGDVLVNEVTFRFNVHNPASGTSMVLDARVSLTGTATPQTPFLFTAANKPAYFNSAVVLLNSKTYAGGSTTAEQVNGGALAAAIGKPRMWIIVSNTISSLGLGEFLPLELQLQQAVVHATVTKSLAGLAGGLDATGL